jgi:hypothetical protein
MPSGVGRTEGKSMRRFLRVVAGLVVAIASVVAALYVFVPPNTTPEDGPADPILESRRFVVGLLRDVGILPAPGFFSGCPYLPTDSGSSVHVPKWGNSGSGSERVLAEKMTLRIHPVYRGLLWVVGERVSFRIEVFEQDRLELLALRLVYEESGQRTVAGEGTVANGMLDPNGRWARVAGYVPGAWEAYAIEEVSANGTVVESHRCERNP